MSKDNAGCDGPPTQVYIGVSPTDRQSDPRYRAARLIMATHNAAAVDLAAVGGLFVHLADRDRPQ